MKVLQAIVASATETLENRQGYGLVKCSRDLPDIIRNKCRGLGYPEDAQGEPVFAYWREEFNGIWWALLSRTGPATDYSRRQSFVSHILAFEWDQLESLLKDTQWDGFTPCHVFRSFMWQDSWDDTVATWIEPDDDLRPEDFAEPRPLGRDLTGQQTGLLQLFEVDEAGEPRPRRVYMSGAPSNHNQALDIFDRAWLAVDPFLSLRELSDLLPGPKVKPIDCWKATFITHLTGSQPDAFSWVIVPRGTTPPGNRALLDFHSVSTDLPSEAPDNLWPEDLAVRAGNPRDWAISTLQQRIAESSQTRRNRELELVEDGKSSIAKIISQTRDVSIELPAGHVIGQDSLIYTLERSKTIIDEELHKRELELGEAETKLRERIANLDSEYPEIEPLRAALNELGEQTSGHIAAGVDFSPLFNEFKQACSDVRWGCEKYIHQHVYQPLIDELKKSESDLKRRQNELEPELRKLEDTRAEIQSKIDQLQELQIQRNSEKSLHSGLESKNATLAEENKRHRREVDSLTKQKRKANYLTITMALVALALACLWAWQWTKSDEARVSDLEESNTKLNTQLNKRIRENERLTKANDALRTEKQKWTSQRAELEQKIGQLEQQRESLPPPTKQGKDNAEPAPRNKPDKTHESSGVRDAAPKPGKAQP